MDDNLLALAEHYLEMGKPQAAIDKLSEMQLVLDNPAHIAHHIVLSNALLKLNRDTEGLEIAQQLLRYFPEHYDCTTHWIVSAGSRWQTAQEAFDTAQLWRNRHPDDPWFPYIMAYIAYWFSLGSQSELLEWIGECLAMEVDGQSLVLACRIYRHFGLSEQYETRLSQLVEMDPDGLATRQLLLRNLYEKKQYADALSLARESLRKWPTDQELADFEERTCHRLHGSRFELLLAAFDDWTERLLPDRNSVNPRVRRFIAAQRSLSVRLLFLGVILGCLALAAFYLVFFYYFSVVCAERKRKSEESGNRQVPPIHREDELLEFPQSASLLLALPEAKHRFFYVDQTRLVLAGDVWCPAENLHYAWEPESLLGEVSIPLSQIKRIEASGEFLTIHAGALKTHVLHIASLQSMNFLISHLARFGFSSTKVKTSSRIITIILSVLLTKIGFGVATLLLLSGAWFLAAMCAIVTVINVSNYFFYRLFNPSRTSVHQRPRGRTAQSAVQSV